MRDAEVTEGEVTLLKCEITGNPLPNVSWFREGMSFYFTATLTVVN